MTPQKTRPGKKQKKASGEAYFESRKNAIEISFFKLSLRNNEQFSGSSAI